MEITILLFWLTSTQPCVEMMKDVFYLYQIGG